MRPVKKTGRKRILVVDEDEVFTEVIGRILTALDYSFVASNDPHEALETFESIPDQFDLVIADELMPTMKGTYLIRRMLETRADLPAILVTTRGDPAILEEARDAGALDVLVRPVLKEELQAALDAVLPGKRSAS